MLVAGDLADRAHAKTIIPKAVEEFGRVDVLVNNAAFQMSHETLDEVSDEEWDHTVAVNLTAMFSLTKDAIPHMPPGGVDHQLVVGQLRHAEPEAGAVCDDQGGRSPTSPRALAQMCREGHPGQQRRARARSGRR